MHLVSTEGRRKGKNLPLNILELTGLEKLALKWRDYANIFISCVFNMIELLAF